MDWEYIRIWSGVLGLAALGAALLWALGFAVVLHRTGSQGWASTRRLLGRSQEYPFGCAIFHSQASWIMTSRSGCEGIHPSSSRIF